MAWKLPVSCCRILETLSQNKGNESGRQRLGKEVSDWTMALTLVFSEPSSPWLLDVLHQGLSSLETFLDIPNK